MNFSICINEYKFIVLCANIVYYQDLFLVSGPISCLGYKAIWRGGGIFLMHNVC